MTNVEITQNHNIQNSLAERADMWMSNINLYLKANRKSPIDFSPILEESIHNLKTFTGATTATGQGLIETRVSTPITFVGNRGGVLIEAGVDYKPNSNYNVTFNSFQLNGSYQQIACGTDTANEISTFAANTATLLRERAEIQGCEDVIARTPDRSQLLLSFELALENEKLLLADRKAVAAVTTNPSVAAIDPATLQTYGPIADAMLSMQANLAGMYSEPGTGHIYVMNQTVLSKLLREQDSSGKFQNGSYFERSYENGRRPSSGLVGYFDGFPVYVTNGVLSTYTTNASGVITAQTGGNKSAVLFGLPFTLGIARGPAEYDMIQVFTPQNDRQSYYEGEVTIGAATYMAAVVKSPAAWNYFAV